jgi:predicted Zn-dependent protease
MNRRYGRWWLMLMVLAIVFVIPACSTVPVTGRSGLHLVSNSQLASMAVDQYQQTLKESKLSTDQAKTAMVREVGISIANAAEDFLKRSGRTDLAGTFNWEFNLIEDDKTVNAWVLPGGKAAVYTGILKYTQTETGLAVVLGHEVGHAIAGHGNERMSQGLLTQLGGAALAVALSQQPAQTQALFMGAYGLGTSVGVLLPYSRLHESEADRIGLVLMAMAGYDPREAVPFWQRMNQEGGERPAEFLSTHPAPDTRIKDIQKHLPEALAYYEKARKK